MEFVFPSSTREREQALFLLLDLILGQSCQTFCVCTRVCVDFRLIAGLLDVTSNYSTGATFLPSPTQTRLK